MRTTISLDERLLEQLKHRAVASGTTVSRLVEQAVRLLLKTSRAHKHEDRFELVTFGRGGNFTNQNIDKASRLLAEDDLARYGDR
jgi:hypothetical protein